MNVKPKNVTIEELVKKYQDNGEDGVTGYNGNLDIRPKYQREFVYKDKPRDAVIDTVVKDLPLNVMYWADIGNNKYEIIDGQQRTISICQYINGDFSIMHPKYGKKDKRYFENLDSNEKKQILNYELMVYECSGTDKEKLDWFRIVNIAGEKLTDQELRNAVYAGPWVTDAKKYFSKRGCAAYDIAHKYLNGSAIRQDYLETAIRWIDEDIEEYMAKHQHKKSAIDLWHYFEKVIDWVEKTFPKEYYRKEMKGLPWGELYKDFKDKKLDPVKLEAEVKKLMIDDEVTKKKGIYEYVLTRKEKHLNLRSFTEAQKREAYERQNGICPICKNEFEYEEMEGDHITPWVEGGKTDADNCQMLCIECNRTKSKK